MIDYLIILILLGETILFVWFDKIIYRTWVTPFSVLAVPFTIVAIFVFFFAPAFGFIELYTPSILLWVLGLFVFWMAGLTIGMPLGRAIRNRANNCKTANFIAEQNLEKLVLILSWCLIFAMLYGLIAALTSLGIKAIGSNEFAELYGSGLVGHLRIFSMVLTIFLIGTASCKKKINLITVFPLLILQFLYPTKSWIIISVLAGIIYRISTGKTKLSVSRIIILFLVVLVIFISNYLVAFWAMTNGEGIYNIDIYNFLIRHFLAYIFAGPLALGEAMKTGTMIHDFNPEIIFAPFINLYAFITSNELVNPIVDHIVLISLDGAKKSNVHTFFGALLIHLGVVSSFVYILIFSIVIHGIFAAAYIAKNCWIIILWSFVAALLSISWFDMYFNLLPVIEIPVYCLILFFFSPLFSSRFDSKMSYCGLIYRKPTHSTL